MTDHRWTPRASDVTDALRAHYAAPADERYWDALEARILAHVARGGAGEGWWSALVEMARPALAAAAILVLVAGAAVVHTRQLEARNAYASVISAAAPPSVESSARLSSTPDGDATINYILSH
jgi:hypothetical protein